MGAHNQAHPHDRLFALRQCALGVIRNDLASQCFLVDPARQALRRQVTLRIEAPIAQQIERALVEHLERITQRAGIQPHIATALAQSEKLDLLT